METIASNVRRIRLDLGLTQEQLASAAGVSQTTIDKIENGKTLRSRFLPFIAKALNVTLEDLDESMKSNAQLFNEAIEKQQNIFKLISPEKMPLYNYNGSSVDPRMSFPEKPPMVLDREYIAEDPNSYAVFIGTNLMSPEIEPGDIVVFDTLYAMLPGSTGMFLHKEDGGRIGIIGRFVKATEQAWIVRLWSMDKEMELPQADWPVMHRLRTRVTRR